MSTQPINVLLIEDNPDVAQLIRKLLQSQRRMAFHMEHAKRLATGLEYLSANHVNAVLLDLSLPDSTGLATLTRARTHAPYTPIIILTSLDNEELALESLRQGAQDYLIKGQTDGELLARALRYAIERKRAEETVRRSEAFLDSIIEHSPHAMWISDDKGTLLRLNQACRDLLHITDAEVVGKYNVLQDNIVEEQGVMPLVKRVFEEGKTAKFSLRYDSSRIKHLELEKTTFLILDVKISPVLDAGGQVTNAIIQHVDITERVRAEEALRTSQAQLSNAMKIARLGYWEYDVASDLFTFDDHFYAIFRTTAEQVGGYTMTSAEYAQRFVHPDDRALVGIEVRNALETTDPHYNRQLEHRIIYADGEIGCIAVRFFVVKDGQGRTIKTIGANQDITERKRAEEQIRKRNAELTTLNQIGQALSKLAAPAEIYETIFTLVGQVLDNRNLYIALYDSTNQQITFPVYTMNGTRHKIAGRRFSNGLTEYVIRTNTPLFIQRDLPGVMVERGIALLGTPARAFLAVPMRAGEKILGVIALQDYEKEDVYDEQHLELLTTIAAQAATALENARLFSETQHRADELAALNQIATAVSQSLNLDDILNVALDELTRTLHLPKAWVYLLDAQTETLKTHAEHGWLQTIPEHNILRLGEGISGKVAQDGQPRALNIADSALTTHDRLLAAGYRSIAAVPLRSKAHVAGVLGVASEQRDRFGEAEMRWLGAVGNTITAALENARLFAETTEYAQRQKVLYDISTALARVHDVREMCAVVVAAARENLRYPFMGIFLVEPDTGDRVLVAQSGWDNAPPNWRHHPGVGLSENAFLTGKLQYTPDVTREPKYVPARTDSRSEIDVPIKIGDTSLGMIVVEDPRVDAYGAADFDILQAIANQLAVALENARLFEEQQASLAMTTRLYELSAQVLTATTVEETARLVTETVRAGFAADACTIQLFSQTDTAAFRLSAGFAPVFDQEAQERPVGLTERARLSKEPIVARGEELNPRVRAEGIEANIALPLPGEQDNLGVLFIGYRHPRQFSARERNLMSLFANHAALALRRARLHDETQRRAAQQTALNAIVSAANKIGADIQAILEIALEHTLNALGLPQGVVWVNPSQTGEPLSALHSVPPGAANVIREAPLTDQSHFSHTLVINDSSAALPATANRMEQFGAHAAIAVPLETEGKCIGGLSVGSPTPREWSPEEIALVEAVGHQLAIAAERARLFRETRRRLNELEAVNQVSTALRSAATVEEILPRLLDETLRLFHTDTGFLSLYDRESGELRRRVARGWWAESPPLPLHPGKGIVGHVYVTGEPYLSRELASDPHTRDTARGRIRPGWGGACIPIRTTDEVIGVIVILVPHPRELSHEEVHVLTTLAEIAGNAIQRAGLHAQTEENLQRLTVLRTIDNAINASLDLRVTLNVVLSQIVAQLGVDAAAVLLLNPHTQTLEHIASRGFRSPRAQKMSVRLGEGFAGRAALERRTLFTADLPGEGTRYARATTLADDNFVTYYGTPLIAKGTVKGILEVFNRAPLAPNVDWVDFLETLSGQVAIAIDNAELFDTLQHTNSELVMAYDATIEGWSRALDLRDRETEGHTQRVTELTLRLARALGVGETELIHIRRGALLHDIGKVGIPDGILHKPGALTDAEWHIMRQHPLYARDLIAPIAYLRPATDIPYCHHEKWDGSGYPRGLKGEQIPLSARIFAIVDVWDALSSDRPYRKAWGEERVREHIRAQSGTHFEPRVVEAFLEMLASK